VGHAPQTRRFQIAVAVSQAIEDPAGAERVLNRLSAAGVATELAKVES